MKALLHLTVTDSPPGYSLAWFPWISKEIMSEPHQSNTIKINVCTIAELKLRQAHTCSVGMVSEEQTFFLRCMYVSIYVHG